MDAQTTGTEQRTARGVTLVEVVTSMVAATILLGGIASALLVASRALPESGNGQAAYAEAAALLGQISSELACAQRIIGSGARHIVFEVADRNADTLPETIRYHWSGTVGDPLYRQYNSNEATIVLPSVRDFALAYETFSVTTTGDPTESESAETELRSYDATTSLSDFKIKSSAWAGEFFKPNLPADTIRWKVTRVVLMAAKEGPANGVASVLLCTARADRRPNPAILAQTTLLESALSSSYSWYSLSFPTPPVLAPGDLVCFLVCHVSDADACKLRYRSGGVAVPNLALLSSSTGGLTWTVESDKSLLFYVYGTVTTPGPPEVIVTQYLKRVRLSVCAGDASARPVETSVPVLNAPVLNG